MVKLIKTALSQVLGEARRLPSLVELHTFVSDAMRIVNDRPLTTISDPPNDLTPLTPSCFLSQQLSPNTFTIRGICAMIFNTALRWLSGFGYNG